MASPRVFVWLSEDDSSSALAWDVCCAVVDEVGEVRYASETMPDEGSRLETVSELVELESSLVMLKACEGKPQLKLLFP